MQLIKDSKNVLENAARTNNEQYIYNVNSYSY